MECLSKKEPTIWTEINEVLVGQEAIGSRFPLKCVRHGNVTEVASRQDVDALKHAGCPDPCDAPLQCGHTCKIMCHGQDQEHTGMFKCREKCMLRCNNGHTCLAPCRDPCPPCPFMMPTLLVCGHSRQLECHKANLQAYCTETIEIKLERCGHNQLVLCKLTEQSERHRIVCKSDCKQTFNCGHICKRRCHVSIDPNHLTKFLCDEPCELINKSCPRKHRCKKNCREPCGDCQVKVEKMLLCGHKAEMKCCATLDGYKCHKNCERILPCHHVCKNECCDACGPCKITVEKTIVECGHSIRFKCSDTPTRSHCSMPCKTIKSCGHPCSGRCKEICEELNCAFLVDVVLSCGHKASVACGDVKGMRYIFTTECKAPCEAKLPCGHRCKGTCGNCMEGRVHIPCDEFCNKPLLCIHKCSGWCNDSLHSCPNPKCFNTCWREELKSQPVRSRQVRGKKKQNAYNPRTRMAYEIRSALGELNDQMGKVARRYDGNKIVVQSVIRIQLLVNNSRTISKRDEELPILKTCLFKVEFITSVIKIMVRLGLMKLPKTKNLEVEHFMECLVTRVASNSALMGFYEMTQLQEQLVWVSMLLDNYNAAAFLGADNDSDFTETVFSCLDQVKSSFGSNERSSISLMLREYNKRKAVNVPLTGANLMELFPATNKFCKPVCHHRVDVVLEKVEQNEGQSRAKAADDVGLTKTKVGVKSTTEGRSLVCEDFNSEGFSSVESINWNKRAKLKSCLADEDMEIEVIPEENSTSKCCDGDQADQSQNEKNPLVGNARNPETIEAEKEAGQPTKSTESSACPYSEASKLLSHMMLKPNNPCSPTAATTVDSYASRGQNVTVHENQGGCSNYQCKGSSISIETATDQTRALQSIQSTDSLRSNKNPIVDARDIQQKDPRTKAAAIDLGQVDTSSPELNARSRELREFTLSAVQAKHRTSNESNGNPFMQLDESCGATGLDLPANNQCQVAAHHSPLDLRPSLNQAAGHQLRSLHNQFSKFAVQSDSVASSSHFVETKRSNAESAASSNQLNRFAMHAESVDVMRSSPSPQAEQPHGIVQAETGASIYIDDID